jgi:hypothetical protein
MSEAYCSTTKLASAGVSLFIVSPCKQCGTRKSNGKKFFIEFPQIRKAKNGKNSISA